MRLSARWVSLCCVSQSTPVPALETVRLARGLSQKDLADLAGISQAAISKAEAGAAVTSDRLEALSEALGCAPELLMSPEVQLSATACVFHRKRASTTVGQAKQARAVLALTRVHAEALLDAAGVAPARLPRSAPSEDGYTTPEDLAVEVRQALGLPRGPIEDLVGALESVGVVVAGRTIEGRRLDALSDWLAGHRPVFLVNDAAPVDRQRFTLAHETGHAVMHSVVTERAEEEADRFAAELLMPAADIRGDLERPTLERLLALKGKWRVSAAALARRAYDLGVINDHGYRRLNMEMSASGWRQNEPELLSPERPRLLREAYERALSQTSPDVLARRVFLPVPQLAVMFGEGEPE